MRFYVLLAALAGALLGTAQHSETGNPATMDDKAAQYWEEKLRTSSPDEQEQIRKVIELIRLRPRHADRVAMSRAVKDIQATLGMWQARLQTTATTAENDAFHTVIDVLPKAGDDGGTGASGCDGLRQTLADDEKRKTRERPEWRVKSSPTMIRELCLRVPKGCRSQY